MSRRCDDVEGIANGASVIPLQKKRRPSESPLVRSKEKRVQRSSSFSHPPPPHLAHLSPPTNLSEIYYYVPDWRPAQGSWHCGCLSAALVDTKTLQPQQPDSYSFQKFCHEILGRVPEEECSRVVHAQILLSGNYKEYWCFADEGGFNTFLIWLHSLVQEGALSQAGVSVVFCELDEPWGEPACAQKLPWPDPRCPGFE